MISLINSNCFRFSYYGTTLDDMTKVKKAIFMFVDLFGLERFEYDTLVSGKKLINILVSEPYVTSL